MILVGEQVREVHERISRGLDITAATMPATAAAAPRRGHPALPHGR